LQFSAPLATGKLLGLDAERLTHAIALAATHSNSLNAVSRGSIPSSKSITDGMVAANGVIAALLAEKALRDLKTSWRAAAAEISQVVALSTG